MKFSSAKLTNFVQNCGLADGLYAMSFICYTEASRSSGTHCERSCHVGDARQDYI